jgi:hypothetical protein
MQKNNRYNTLTRGLASDANLLNKGLVTLINRSVAKGYADPFVMEIMERRRKMKVTIRRNRNRSRIARRSRRANLNH